MNVYIHIYILLSLKECFNLILISLFSSLSLVQKFLIIFIPKLFPEQLPVPSPSCFLLLFFFNPSGTICDAQIFMDAWFSNETCSTHRGYPFRENCTYFSPQLTITSSTAGGGVGSGVQLSDSQWHLVCLGLAQVLRMPLQLL